MALSLRAGVAATAFVALVLAALALAAGGSYRLGMFELKKRSEKPELLLLSFHPVC